MTKVLVVEDEQSLREPLVYLLQREGFDIIEAVRHLIAQRDLAARHG